MKSLKNIIANDILYTILDDIFDIIFYEEMYIGYNYFVVLAAHTYKYIFYFASKKFIGKMNL